MTGVDDARAEPIRWTARAGLVGRFRRERLAVVAVALLASVVAAAILAPWLAPADPAAQDLAGRLRPPGPGAWLGTDHLGRDTLSRALFGARLSLLAAVQATAIAVVLGVPLGLVAGLVRGWFDVLASLLADAVLSIPALVLALAIIGVLEPNLTNAMVAIGVVYAPRLFRVVRGAAMAVREQPFVEAARVSGVTTATIARTHVLPNVLPALVVQVSLAAGFAVLAEATLSFLGVGAQPPAASWGVMLGQATSELERHPFVAAVPSAAIIATVLAFNVIGDALNASTSRGDQRR